MKKRAFALPLAAVILITGCATVPSGPSVMVLPGTGKGFDQFQSDDYACRAWATQNVGSPGDTATRRTVTGAAVGTLLGAAAGAAIGAAA
ncbi:MAG: glycine zipper family protein, partial [Candidatus Rokubacteria bacterium]|nr:glycine zipper family protein [Candidatus Rokubacteria bacterium]